MTFVMHKDCLFSATHQKFPLFNETKEMLLKGLVLVCLVSIIAVHASNPVMDCAGTDPSSNLFQLISAACVQQPGHYWCGATSPSSLAHSAFCTTEVNTTFDVSATRHSGF